MNCTCSDVSSGKRTNSDNSEPVKRLFCMVSDVRLVSRVSWAGSVPERLLEVNERNVSAVNRPNSDGTTAPVKLFDAIDKYVRCVSVKTADGNAVPRPSLDMALQLKNENGSKKRIEKL